MSDRLSSVEIEDVLSSIRRLVTDDLRPKVVQVVPPVPEKLLLTPALRVVQYVPDAPFAEVPEDIHAIEETVAAIGAAVQDQGYEPETGDDSLDAVLPVPEWPESTWTALDMAEEGETAEVIAPASVGVSPADNDAMQAWADEAEAEVMANLQADAQVFPQSMTFDEQVLRDLVRDLIREELQGAFGERITRNVRKLVRAELNRVTAVTDTE
jgi:hypothetical protein